jgi:hypothetical protein
MIYNHKISPQKLANLLEYCEKTGVLTWKERDLTFFPDKRAWRIWNTRYAGNPAGGITRGYHRVRILGDVFFAHRVAWAIYYGRWPEDQLDHINGITDDNRIINLREVDNSTNSMNTKLPANNKSGRIGVFFDTTTESWRAAICVKGKTKELGKFNTFSEACTAREEAERLYGFSVNHGRTGFPSAAERGR